MLAFLEPLEELADYQEIDSKEGKGRRNSSDCGLRQFAEDASDVCIGRWL